MTKKPQNKVSYSAARMPFPNLPREDSDKLVVFIGYESCPFSHKTLDLIQQFGPRTHFEVVDRARGSHVKRQLGNDSFPIVFVRAQSGKMIHVGGADDLEELLEEIPKLEEEVEQLEEDEEDEEELEAEEEEEEDLELEQMDLEEEDDEED